MREFGEPAGGVQRGVAVVQAAMDRTGPGQAEFIGQRRPQGPKHLGRAPERAERVFEPFYQVDGSPTRAHGGVGVGLAIARRVARGLGGDLRVAGGATVEGTYLTGAAFSMAVAKLAPTVVVEATN